MINNKPHLVILQYDEWRAVYEDGTEEFPEDCYKEDEAGRIEYARDIMEYKMRC